MSRAIIYLEKMRINIFYNYLAQVYLAAAGLVTLPFLLQKMGAELYAFVAVLFTVQSIFSILDGGLSGSLSREFALCNGGFIKNISAKVLLRKSEWLFASIAAAAFFLMYAGAAYFSNNWLKLNKISNDVAMHYLLLIGAIAAFRMISALYRAVLIGYERQKKLSIINMAVTTGRYFFILPLLGFVDDVGMFYFKYQLALAIFEFAVLKFAANSSLSSSVDRIFDDGVSVTHFRSVFKTSSQIWALTLIWVLSNQLDKLILSKLISLEEFGYFSIVASISAGLLLLAAPVTNAAMPKLTGLIKERNFEEAANLYFKVTKVISTFGFPVAITLIAAPNHALFLFTNNYNVSERFSGMLILYVCGSLLTLLSGLTFLLNQAIGDLSKNIRQNFYSLIALFVLMLVLTYGHGEIGAAYAYFSSSVVLMLIVIKPLNVLDGVNFHGRWVYLALCKPLFIGVPALTIFILYNPALSSRVESFVWLVIMWICVLILYSLFFVMDGKGKVR